MERAIRIHGASQRADEAGHPATLAIVFLLLYFNFRNVGETLIVMLSVPFALVGGVWYLWLLGYNWSVAVAIGFIALAGVAAETGVVMLIYLDHAWKAKLSTGSRPSLRDLYEAVLEGAVERVRPKMMTVTAIMAGVAANPVGFRCRCQRHEAHCGADGWWHDQQHHSHAGRDPSDLLVMEAA
jgi:Cu/Ag efflux pump CusA